MYSKAFKNANFLTDEDIAAMQVIDVLKERTVQDYRSAYNDIRDWFRRERNGKAPEDSKIDWDVCRAEADWLVGLNATRALTCKYNAQLSCGRVQTPTLAMIAKREEEIRKFVPKPYYGLQLQAEPASPT